MADDSRAWQRSLKNGKTEWFATVEGRVSVRVVGEDDDCRRVIERVEEITGVTLTDRSLSAIPGQLTIDGDVA